MAKPNRVDKLQTAPIYPQRRVEALHLTIPVKKGEMMNPVGKHSSMTVSTDFDLEPVIEQFRAEYGTDPNIEVPTIVFKSLDERVAGDRAYILLFELRPIHGRKMGFHEFLKAYCVLHKKTAIGTGNGVFPSIVDPRGFHVLGKPENNRK